MRRLEKQGRITYTEVSDHDDLELECPRLKSICEKIANFPLEWFKA